MQQSPGIRAETGMETECRGTIAVSEQLPLPSRRLSHGTWLSPLLAPNILSELVHGAPGKFVQLVLKHALQPVPETGGVIAKQDR